MATPNEITALLSEISPKTIEQFCRLKFPSGEFDRCDVGNDQYFSITYAKVAEQNTLSARALREFLDLTVDKTVQVVGRFQNTIAKAPIPVYSIGLAGSISSRSSRKKQADFAKFLLGVARNDLARYRSDWSRRYTTGLFFFYDEVGNFRMSLIESDEKRFRRQTFFVEHDATGTKNRTFRYRMTNAKSNEKAARGEVEKWTSFQDIKEAFSIEALNKEFYRELSNWYFWALKRVKFPEVSGDKKEDGTEGKATQRNATNLIRLITRLMFVWFMKEKKLVPEALFKQAEIEGMLNLDDPTGSTYYKAVLQNLFFATLNTEMGNNRVFVEDQKEYQGKRDGHGIQYYYRYKRYLRDPKAFLELMRDIPFLNGGLFTCLDEIESNDQGKKIKEVRVDGFSTQLKNAELVSVPDALFWYGTVPEDKDARTVEPDKSFDLTDITGEKKKVGVYGLIPLLQRYNFTVDESSKDDETVALDPELLGRVFENLLASYNPETSTTARKATGSFYTPREIVNYMVEESLVQHLKTALKIEADESAEAALRKLVADGEVDETWFTAKRKEEAIAALKACTILDPACGSGAFPMGILQAMLRAFDALEPIGEDDAKLYERKLELIENCIYGVDIQPIAVQISKLRCFISLLAEDAVDDKADNRGIEPLPNLEMHFVAANSLIGVEKFGSQTTNAKGRGKGKGKTLPDQLTFGDTDSEINGLKQQLTDLRHAWLTARSSSEKKSLPAKFLAKQKQLAEALTRNEWYGQDQANTLVTWNPFDQNKESIFFDMEWMFGIKEGFDVVIGNPPYIGESGHKELFRKTKEGSLGEFYMGKMDYFYFFFHLALNLVRSKGQVSFITTNYFCTATGARKLRADFKRRAMIIRLIDFNELHVFESALGQHNMITILRKNVGDEIVHTCITNRTGFADPQVLTHILRSDDEHTQYYNVLQEELYDGSENYIRLNRELVTDGDKEPKLTINAILDKVASQGVRLGQITNINQGVVSGCDYVSKRNADRLSPSSGDWKLGDGIFVLNLENVRDQSVFESFPSDELSLLCDFFKNTDVKRFWCASDPTKKIIYFPAELDNRKFPTIYKHLLRFKGILYSRLEQYDEHYHWTAHHRPRSENIFKGEKIVVPYRSTTNAFAYNNTEWFCRSDCYVITQKSHNYTLGFLLALLNSKLYYQWLFHRGKRKGKMLEMFQTPLSEIPIKKIAPEDQKSLSGLAERIVAAKKADPSADTSTLEAEIDRLVYDLYGLTEEEIAIVEGSVKEKSSASAKAMADKEAGDPRAEVRSPKSEGGSPKSAGGRKKKPSRDAGLDL